MPASAAASLKRLKERTTPGSASDVVVKSISSVPKNLASAAAAAPLKVLWPDVYDGNGGVFRSGIHWGSAVSFSFFNSPALRMAVTGRQKSHLNLHSQQQIAASASATFRSAKSRALSSIDRPRFSATVAAMRFQCPGGVTVPSPSAQNFAISV